MKNVKTKAVRLSKSQESVLVEGCIHKLSRSPTGWSVYDGTCPLWVYHPSTIKSLLNQGLLDANFIDPGGVGKCLSLLDLQIQTLDGARYREAPDVPQLMVWTSALGRKVLGDNGVLPEVDGHLYN